MEDVKNKSMRLDRYFSSQSLCSRKEAVKRIRGGLVSVNNAVVKDPGAHVAPGSDQIRLSGLPLDYQQFTYLMMNKPADVLSAARDSRAPTVLQLLPHHLLRRGLFPAGRLDKDTTGLLIITDDGDYAHRMLSPKNKVYKLYRAGLRRAVTEVDIKHFHDGISFQGAHYAPAELTRTGNHEAIVKICEGKYHQVKHMFEFTGNEVMKLQRIQIGDLMLDQGLKQGETRSMTPQEAHRVFL